MTITENFEPYQYFNFETNYRALRGWRANLSYVVDVLAWLTCQRGCRGWCTSVGKVAGVLAWLTWVAYSKVSRAGDIRGNTRVVS